MNESSICDWQLMKTILGNGKAADSVFSEIGSIVNVGRIGGERLRRLNGVTESGAERFEAFVELHRRLIDRVRVAGKVVKCSADIFNLLKGKVRFMEEEQFMVLSLDTKNHINDTWTVAVGSLSECQVLPREVFKRAIFNNAFSLVLAHNHPSSDHTPSSDDIRLTTRLAKAGELLGISVLDHIVIGGDGYSSLRDLGVFTGETYNDKAAE